MQIDGQMTQNGHQNGQLRWAIARGLKFALNMLQIHCQMTQNGHHNGQLRWVADWWSDDPKWTPTWATSVGYRSRFEVCFEHVADSWSGLTFALKMMQIDGQMTQNEHHNGQLRSAIARGTKFVLNMMQIDGRMTQNGHQKWGNDADWLSDGPKWTPKVG